MNRKTLGERLEEVRVSWQKELDIENETRRLQEKEMRALKNRDPFARYLFGNFYLEDERSHEFNPFGHPNENVPGTIFTKPDSVRFNIFNPEDGKQVKKILFKIVHMFLEQNPQFQFKLGYFFDHQAEYFVEQIYSLVKRGIVNGLPFKFQSFYEFLQNDRNSIVDKINLLLFTVLHEHFDDVDDVYAEQYDLYRADIFLMRQRMKINVAEYFRAGMTLDSVLQFMLKDYLQLEEEGDKSRKFVFFDREIREPKTDLRLGIYEGKAEVKTLLNLFVNNLSVYFQAKYFGWTRFWTRLRKGELTDNDIQLVEQLVDEVLTKFRQSIVVDSREIR